MQADGCDTSWSISFAGSKISGAWVWNSFDFPKILGVTPGTRGDTVARCDWLKSDPHAAAGIAQLAMATSRISSTSHVAMLISPSLRLFKSSEQSSVCHTLAPSLFPFSQKPQKTASASESIIGTVF